MLPWIAPVAKARSECWRTRGISTHPANVIAGRVGGTFALAARAGGAPVHELVDAAAILPVVQDAEDDPDAVPPCLQDGYDGSSSLPHARFD